MCPPEAVSVILRIEGKNRTIFEGPVTTTYRRVTTLRGGTRHCNGQNNNNNSCPGPTCTTALADAEIASPDFGFDGTYDERFDDFLITSIGGETPGANEFWSICLNFRPTTVGGCQQIVRHNDQVLFALASSGGGGNRTTTYLRLYGPTSVIRNVALIATDGNGAPVGNVPVRGIGPGNPERRTDANGVATFNDLAAGTFRFKAHNAATNLVSIRSSELVVTVRTAG